MPAISMKELLEAGVHFGHQTKRWNRTVKFRTRGSKEVNFTRFGKDMAASSATARAKGTLPL